MFESRDQMHVDRRHARVLRVDVLALLLLLLVFLLLLLLLLLLLVLIPARRRCGSVAVVLLAVGRQLDFDDGRVVGLLERLGVVVGVHHEEVVVAGEDHGLAVGRERRPARRPRLVVVLEQRDPRGGQVVLEVQRLVPRRRRRAAPRPPRPPCRPVCVCTPCCGGSTLSSSCVEPPPLVAALLRCSVVVSRGLVEGMTAAAGTCKSNSNAVSFLTNRTVVNGRCCAS